jgi:cobalt-zinc-cadmium efflux system outer membrane protein
MNRRSTRRIGAAIIAVIGVAAGAQPPAPTDLTLDAALAEAQAHNPELRAAAAAVEEARGRLVAARSYPYNPAIELEAADRSGPSESSTDRGVALSQELEIAGQRGKRTGAARAGLAAAEARYARRHREVLAAVERAFAETVRARELLEVARADVELTRSLLSLEERRLEAGAGTQIEVNLARAAAGRTVRRIQEATAASWEARARLAEATGLDPAAPPATVGGLPLSTVDLPPLEELTRLAYEERADLAALRRDREQAERRVALERSLAIPNLKLGAFASREEGDELTGLSVGIALPLFDRNQGGIAESKAAVSRVAAEVAAAELTAGREIAAAYGHYQAAAEALAALEGLVVETLAASLDLLRRAVEAGKLSATDVLLMRRELVEAQREQIETAGELWLARNELELAVGTELPDAAREENGDED